MKCKNCGSSDMHTMVDVTLSIPFEYFNRLTKKSFRDRRVRLWAAKWDKCSFICGKCGYTVRTGE